LKHRHALRRFLQGKQGGVGSADTPPTPNHHQNGALKMATQESTPTAAVIDLTPSIAITDARRNLITVDPTATERELIVLADVLAMQLVELVDFWPSDQAMPAALNQGMHNLQQILCHLANAPLVKQAQ
jgi:hypothetical protein